MFLYYLNTAQVENKDVLYLKMIQASLLDYF